MLARGTHSYRRGLSVRHRLFGEKGSWESGIWMEGLGNQAARGRRLYPPF